MTSDKKVDSSDPPAHAADGSYWDPDELPSDVHVRLTVISTNADVPQKLRGVHNLKVKSFEQLCEWVRRQFGDRYSEWEILTGAHWPLTMAGFQQYVNLTSVELPLILHLRNQKHVFQRHLKQATDVVYQEAMQRIQGEQSLRWEDVRSIKDSVGKVQKKLDVLKDYIQCPPQRVGGRTLWALVLVELPVFFWLAMMAIANGVEQNESTMEKYSSDSQNELEHMAHHTNRSFHALHQRLDDLAVKLAAARDKDEVMREHAENQWKEVHLQLTKSRTALDTLMVRVEHRYNLSAGNVTARNVSATDQALKKNLTWIDRSLARLEQLKQSSNATVKPTNNNDKPALNETMSVNATTLNKGEMSSANETHSTTPETLEGITIAPVNTTLHGGIVVSASGITISSTNEALSEGIPSSTNRAAVSSVHGMTTSSVNGTIMSTLNETLPSTASPRRSPRTFYLRGSVPKEFVPARRS